MTAVLHLWNLLRARLSLYRPVIAFLFNRTTPPNRDQERRTQDKRRLELLLRQHRIPRSQARDICWHFFNAESKKS